MIGMIKPLVQVATNPKEKLEPFALYASGTIASSTILGVTLGSLGNIFVPSRWLPPTIGIIAVIGAAMALSDFGIGGTRTLTTRRQTCPVWWRTLGRSRAIFLWGVDLGLGFTTIRVASLYWIVVLTVFALASPLAGAAILCGYGCALVLNLGTGVLLLEREGSKIAAHIRALRSSYSLKIGLAIILLLWSALLFSLALHGIMG